MTTRIAIIGGFLGAGKTTLITTLAKRLTEDGKRVGLIMNDQGEALVDTNYSCGLGLEVEEVLRGCFCCRFPDFMHSARTLVDRKGPEVILAEPVGSCTDLLATVVAPLKIVYPKEFSVAPLMIMVDSVRVLKDGIESNSIGGVLRTHQIEEAEYVVLSKVDLVPKKDLVMLRKAIKTINPDCGIITYSSVTGEGLDRISKVITAKKDSARAPKPIDYDTYARAEAELGWYNGRYLFGAKERYDSYALANQILRQIATQFDTGGHRPCQGHGEIGDQRREDEPGDGQHHGGRGGRLALRERVDGAHRERPHRIGTGTAPGGHTRSGGVRHGLGASEPGAERGRLLLPVAAKALLPHDR